MLCVLCVCMHACAFGGVLACLKKNKSTTKSRAMRRLSPRRSCGPAAAHAEVETVEGGAVRGGGGRGCGGEGRLAIPRVLFKRCLSVEARAGTRSGIQNFAGCSEEFSYVRTFS